VIYTVSQSLINAWLLCGERVRRRWVENEIIPPGIAAKIGTGLHGGAEVNHRAKKETGKDEPLNVIQDAARDAYKKSLEKGVFFPVDELSSAKKQLSKGLDTTIALAGLYRKDLAPKIKPVLVEEKISFQHPDIEIPFSGIVDVYDSNGWLPDLKTSATSWNQLKADTHIQPTIYNKLVQVKTGQYPEKLSFEIFVKTKIPKYQTLETRRTEEDFNLLVERVRIMLIQINAGFFPPADPTSWTCSPKWCGYFYTCPCIPSHRKILPKRSA
jgi:hypothetical protein